MEMRYFTNSIFLIIIIIIASLATCATRCEGLWVTSKRKLEVPAGYNAPQQVHVIQGNIHGNAVMVSWVMPKHPGSSMVLYGTSKHILDEIAWGKWQIGRYSKYYYFEEGYLNYHYNHTSDIIHHCFINNLDFDTKYYYVVGIGYTVRRFWFKTPPSFGDHRTLSKAETVLYGRDLSYADNNRWEWDTWGLFVETADHNAPRPLFPTPRGNCQLSNIKRALCKIALIAITPCFPHIRTRNSGPTSAPSAACCEIFIKGLTPVRAGREDCVCSLLWDPLLLDFPVDTNRLVSLFSSCGASDLASSWFHDICGGTYLPSSSTAHVALRLSGSTSHLYTIRPSGLTPLLRTSLC